MIYEFLTDIIWGLMMNKIKQCTEIKGTIPGIIRILLSSSCCITQ